MAKAALYCIYDPGVSGPLESFQEIARNIQEKGKISEFHIVDVSGNLDELRSKVNAGDIVVVLLTSGVTAYRPMLKTLLSNVRSRFSNLAIVEIIVDNVEYENTYITLPADYVPLRDRPDGDRAWAEIQRDIDQLIPEPVNPFKKYVTAALVVFVGLILITLVFLLLDRPKPDFSYRITDHYFITYRRHKTQCRAIFKVKFF